MGGACSVGARSASLQEPIKAGPRFKLPSGPTVANPPRRIADASDAGVTLGFLQQFFKQVCGHGHAAHALGRVVALRTHAASLASRVSPWTQTPSSWNLPHCVASSGYEGPRHAPASLEASAPSTQLVRPLAAPLSCSTCVPGYVGYDLSVHPRHLYPALHTTQQARGTLPHDAHRMTVMSRCKKSTSPTTLSSPPQTWCRPKSDPRPKASTAGIRATLQPHCHTPPLLHVDTCRNPVRPRPVEGAPSAATLGRLFLTLSTER